MNEIVSKLLSAEYKFMPDMHLKQLKFTQSTCGPFTKNKETGDLRYDYKNELEKSCFQHDMAYGDFKDLQSRTASFKVLGYKTFNIARHPKHD